VLTVVWRNAAVTPRYVASQRLSWSGLAQEGSGIHVKEADGDDDAGPIRIIHGDIHVVRFVLGPVDKPAASRRLRTQAPTALWGRLVTWRPVGIPEAAFARRGQMTWGDAERGIPMLAEVAVIAARLPVFRLRPVLLVFPLALFAVRLIFSRISHRRGCDHRYQQQHDAQTPPYDMCGDHVPALSCDLDAYHAFITPDGQSHTRTDTSPLRGIFYAKTPAASASRPETRLDTRPHEDAAEGSRRRRARSRDDFGQSPCKSYDVVPSKPQASNSH
jgi:hypothetical protein